MNWVVGGLGIWIFADGVGSVGKYWDQTWQEQFIRVVRAGVGLALIAYSAVYL